MLGPGRVSVPATAPASVLGPWYNDACPCWWWGGGDFEGGGTLRGRGGGTLRGGGDFEGGGDFDEVASLTKEHVTVSVLCCAVHMLPL
jgi:hypothetical protein